MVISKIGTFCYKSVTRGRLLLLVTFGWVGGIIRGCVLPLNVTMCLGTNGTSYNVQSPPARRYINSVTIQSLKWGQVIKHWYSQKNPVPEV